MMTSTQNTSITYGHRKEFEKRRLSANTNTDSHYKYSAKETPKAGGSSKPKIDSSQITTFTSVVNNHSMFLRDYEAQLKTK